MSKEKTSWSYCTKNIQHSPRQLTVFGGVTLDGVNLFSASGDCATTAAVNSAPLSRCFAESNGARRLVLTFSHMMTCLRSVSGANLREQTGQRSKRMLGGGISMKISLSCWFSSGGSLCCSGWNTCEYSCPPSKPVMRMWGENRWILISRKN